MLSMLARAASQPGISPVVMSMYCGPSPLPKSQNRAPMGSWHAVMHPPVHPAVALTWHMTDACTLQLPPQLALHCAEQLADGAIPMQLALHWLEHCPMHCPMHVLMLGLLMQLAVQLPLHVAEQLPEQLKLPGLAMHEPEQEPVQPAVQLPVAVTLQPPEMLAWQLMGWQFAVQPPDVSRVHDRFVAPEKSTFPHAAMGAAWAVADVSETRPAVTTAAITDR